MSTIISPKMTLKHRFQFIFYLAEKKYDNLSKIDDKALDFLGFRIYNI